MTVYILFFIFHVIIYGPRVCNKHLNKYQCGFRSIHSTQQAIITLVNGIDGAQMSRL